MTQAMDWTRLPLDDGGRSLVEASAGTGKTWTIAVLYLRLLLERALMPRQVIVSTFTNAAASELRERLRGKLLWALAEAGKHRADAPGIEGLPPDVAWIHARWCQRPDALEQDVQRLQAALAEFDAAPISTLHALCSRILADHPFAAGALFRGREMIDGRTLQAALVADLWRVIAQGGDDDDLVGLARAAGVTLRALQKYVPVLLQADVVVQPVDPAEVRATIGAAIATVIGDSKKWVAEVRAVLSTEGLVNAKSRLAQAWKSTADALDEPATDVVAALVAHRQDLEAAHRGVGINKAGKNDPRVEKLVAESGRIAKSVDPVTLDLAASEPLRAFLSAAQRWCLAAMQARLDAAHQSSFDQLLVTVRDALAPRDGQRALADALFAAWPVALVDEFQDTDPVQFGILDAIYADGQGVARGRLVMIGDPKQAIYRFRGGDIATYERAKKGVPDHDRLTLDTNHRSSRGYVEAVNQFYALAGTRLGPESEGAAIHYQPVHASSRRDDQALCSARDQIVVDRPLVLHQRAKGSSGPDDEAEALRACAGQIAWALSEDGYHIGGAPLQPGDIAVLLPGHAQVAKLAVMLKARGVPCVTGSQASVFDTDIARDLRLVLHAVSHPGDPGALRAALATRLVGESLGALQALRHQAGEWDRHSSRFHALRGTLERGGPLALVSALLEQQAPRLLATVEGERMLTDLRHLGELLQEAWDDGAGGEQLLAWFADQMAGREEAGDAADVRALRLESDDARVRLMTLHASKGLEFGVVFLPLMWKHKRPRVASTSPHLLASPDGRQKYLVEGPAKEVVNTQEFEERYRILYVALTRAVHACHVFLGDGVQKDVALCALDLARYTPDGSSRIRLVAGWESHEGLVWRGGSTTSTTRHARAMPAAPVGPLPMRHSFTTLSGGGRRRVSLEDAAADDEPQAEQRVTERSDADDAVEVPVTEPIRHDELDALSMVAGADFGNAVHALFEHRVPGRPIEPRAVLAALREHGVRPRSGSIEAFVEPLARRLDAVLRAPLDGAKGPRLGDLAAADMRAELEFNYRLDGASLRSLRAACEVHGEHGLVPVREQTLAGLMNGKIDLVFAHGGRFHVLDYKGNQLGAGAQGGLQDYAPAALETTMLDSGYRLQALLYTVALERYLRERLGAGYRRDQHLGDCWYLFIRAVGLCLPDGTPCGVWRHRFGDGLLDAVQAVLGLEREAAA